jgi:hypothetical protein
MKMKVLVMMVLCYSLGLLVTPDSLAAIYKYVDKDGMVYFADGLHSIPEQYRTSAKIVSGEANEGEEKRPVGRDPSPTQAETKTGEAAPVVVLQARPSAEAGGKTSLGGKMLTSAIIVVSALFAFAILGIIDADHKKAVKIVRMVILWGVSVYLLYNHAGDTVHVFSSIGHRIENVRHQSEEKGKKAAKAIKDMNAIMEQSEKIRRADDGEAEREKKE